MEETIRIKEQSGNEYDLKPSTTSVLRFFLLCFVGFYVFVFFSFFFAFCFLQQQPTGIAQCIPQKSNWAVLAVLEAAC